MIAAGEPGHVGDVADHGAGVDRAETEDFGEAGARGPDGRGQLLLGVAELGIQASQVLQKLGGQVAPRRRDRPGRCDLLQDVGSVSCSDLFADPQIAQRFFRRADRHRRVRGLMRIDPDHHCSHQHAPASSPENGRTVAGMPNTGSASARASFEPRHGENRQAGTSI